MSDVASAVRPRVPLMDLARLHAPLREEFRRAFDDTVATSQFILGEAVARFEAEFAAAHGFRECVSVASGTDAIALTLRGLGIGPGDTVVVPALTFVATAEAVVMAGASPVVVDVDPHTLLLDDAAVDEAIGEGAKAVLAVHLYGHVVSPLQLRRWRERGVKVVEDSSQAHLATWRGVPIGIESSASTFSFYPGKNLGALGDGGAVLSHDEGLLQELRRLRDHGGLRKYEHQVIGCTSRLDALQARILSVKLPYLNDWTERRQCLAALYRWLLHDVEQAEVVPWENGAVHHLFVVRVAADRRADIQAELAARGIETGIHYPQALSEHPALRPLSRPCPNAETAVREVLTLPMDPTMSVDDVDRVCAAIRQAVRSARP